MAFEMRPVPGYEELYSVTADGRVWSHEKRHGRGRRPGRWLAAAVNSTGYLCVVLFRSGKGRTTPVHRVVAMAWVANPDNLPEINHRNGVKTSNDAANLEWCTRSHNLRHAYATGLKKPRRGGRLTMEQAARVRQMVASGMKQIRVAEHFGVPKCLINSIVRNRAYLPT